ncbi:unnamed protein product [Mytilus coruscus]|uniref:Uncharacterized protein n=1 Tax=Mytilus coruscus TaxID=42192 RepID=A0A6J8AAZ0_MYTCO|nr:unnamed protein product [Mytilus coruscus]
MRVEQKEKKENEITEVQKNIASNKQHAPELQTFLTMKDIENDIAVEEKFIQSITTSDSTNQVNISCQINTCLLQAYRSLRKLISVLVYGIFAIRNEEQTSPDYGKIIVLKSDGSKDFEISKIGSTFDVVFIGDDSIAVTSGNSKTINIIDLEKQKLKKSIKVDSHNYGTVYKDGHMIYCVREKGLHMIDLSDDSITNVINNKLSSFAYVTTFGDKLFYTNRDNDSVTCCDYHGNILWTFCDTSVLMHPFGISVDNDGNVFVVGGDTHNVVVISPDGQRCRQLLSSKHGLNYPQVLHYDTSTNNLLVAN